MEGAREGKEYRFCMSVKGPPPEVCFPLLRVTLASLLFHLWNKAKYSHFHYGARSDVSHLRGGEKFQKSQYYSNISQHCHHQMFKNHEPGLKNQWRGLKNKQTQRWDYFYLPAGFWAFTGHLGHNFKLFPATLGLETYFLKQNLGFSCKLWRRI